MPIDTPSARYQELEEPRQLPRTLMGGTMAMREAGKTFTPDHPAEDDPDYNLRLNSTTLYNGLADTVKKMVGKVFQKPIIINNDVPSQIEDLLSNIDGQGRNLTSFAMDSFKESMVDGVNFIYVDFPHVQENDQGFATALDQQLQGARPSSIIINAENLIGWKSDNIGGVQQLTEVRIKETVSVENPDDEYTENQVDQIRLLQRGYFEVWRKVEKISTSDEWYLFEQGNTSLDYIPIVPVYTNRVGFYEGEPPLSPLAELNLEHWISSGEQRHALTLARFAMIIVTGAPTKSDGTKNIQKISPNQVIEIEEVNAKWGMVETAGNGITQGFIDVENIEKRMQHCGMTVRVQTAAGVTATAAQIDSEDADSALMAAATSLEDSLIKMLDIFADYMGLPTGGTVKVNTAFAAKKPEGTTEDILKIYVAGDLLSKECALKELKRRNVLSEDLDIDKELQKANDEDINNNQNIPQ